MAIIRIDLITEREYYHGVFTDEKKACNAIDEYMQRNNISNCSMASKEDMIALNAEIADVFDDVYNQENYAEWVEIGDALRKKIAYLLTETSYITDDDVVKVADVLENELDINSFFPDDENQ